MTTVQIAPTAIIAAIIAAINEAAGLRAELEQAWFDDCPSRAFKVEPRLTATADSLARLIRGLPPGRADIPTNFEIQDRDDGRGRYRVVTVKGLHRALLWLDEDDEGLSTWVLSVEEAKEDLERGEGDSNWYPARGFERRYRPELDLPSHPQLSS